MTGDGSWRAFGGPGGIGYQLFHRLRLRLNQKLVTFLLGHLKKNPPPRPLLVLEAGCGPAQASALLNEEIGVAAVGLDYDHEALREAHAFEPSLMLVQADLTRIPFRDASFDCVWNSSTLEHLPDLGLGLKEMVRITRPGGLVFVGVPSRRGPLFFQRWIAGTELGIWIGTVFTKAELARLFHEYGLAGC